MTSCLKRSCYKNNLSKTSDIIKLNKFDISKSALAATLHICLPMFTMLVYCEIVSDILCQLRELKYFRKQNVKTIISNSNPERKISTCLSLKMRDNLRYLASEAAHFFYKFGEGWTI